MANASTMISQDVNFPEVLLNVVYIHCLVIARACCCEIPSIVRKCEKPDFVIVVGEDVGTHRGEIRSVAQMIGVKRGGVGGVVVETIPYPALLGLVEEYC